MRKIDEHSFLAGFSVVAPILGIGIPVISIGVLGVFFACELATKTIVFILGVPLSFFEFIQYFLVLIVFGTILGLMFIYHTGFSKLMEKVDSKFLDKYQLRLYHDVDYFFYHDFYENLDHFMNKFLTLAKFILGTIFICSLGLCLYSLYIFTDIFLDIQIKETGAPGYQLLIKAGWVLAIQIFWSFVWFIIFLIVWYLDRRRAIVEDILKHVDD
jgi:hypothetical protein